MIYEASMPKPKMTIAIVTTHPPGTGSLNEYAYHFVCCLRQKSEVAKSFCLPMICHRDKTITFVQDTVYLYASCPAGKLARGTIPCDKAAVHQVKPDVVLFNLQFATFGKSKIAATLGLFTPALLQSMGYTTVVLHII